MSEMVEIIKELAEKAVKKADTAYRASSLKLSAAALEKMLGIQYRELGEAVYRMCKGGEKAEKEECEEIAALTVRIDSTRRRLAALNKRIDYVLGFVRCPRCKNSVKMKNAYCSACGMRLAAEEEKGVEENENQVDNELLKITD